MFKLIYKPQKLDKSFLKLLKRSFSNQNSDIYNRIIMASFIQAKTIGFNDEAIVAACRDLELPSVTASILKNGPHDVVTFAMNTWL